MPRFLQRLAAIDVGSNTVRLLLAEQDETGHLCPLRRERIITRLAGRYSPEEGIAAECIERTIAALKKFLVLLASEKEVKIIAVTTGVVRKARNKEDFKKMVFQSTGLKLRFLTEDEEAALMLRGILWGYPEKNKEHYLVVDIGGWSTEIVWVKNSLPRYMKSMEIGAVSLSEKFLKHDPPLKEEELLLHRWIKEILNQGKAEFLVQGLPESRSSFELLGTAGTMTTLAAIDQKLSSYDPQKINNYSLSLFQIKKIYRQLISFPARERLKIPGLEKGREDLIVAGTAIVIDLMEIFKVQRLTIIDSGLLEGIILNHYLLLP